MYHPPSTRSVCPVTKLLSSEAKNTTACPMSSGLPFRLIACESSAGNVLAVDLESGRVETLASGLGNPSFAAWSGSGGPYISEFGAGRISLLGGDGVLRPIAAIPQVGPIFFAADGTILTVTLDGRLLGVDLRTGAVRPLLR